MVGLRRASLTYVTADVVEGRHDCGVRFNPQVAYREAVSSHSPASRSACRVERIEVEKPCKGFTNAGYILVEPLRGTDLRWHPTQRALRDAGLWDATPTA